MPFVSYGDGYGFYFCSHGIMHCRVDNKGVFLCVGTGGHVLPAYNVIKSMLDQGIDKKNI